MTAMRTLPAVCYGVRLPSAVSVLYNSVASLQKCIVFLLEACALSQLFTLDSGHVDVYAGFRKERRTRVPVLANAHNEGSSFLALMLLSGQRR